MSRDRRREGTGRAARTTTALELVHDGDAAVVPVVFDGADSYVEIRL